MRILLNDFQKSPFDHTGGYGIRPYITKNQLFAFCEGDEKELKRCNSALNQATTAYQKASKNYEEYTR